MYGTSLLDQALTHHQTRAVQIVDRYWHQLAASGTIPQRSKIDPAALQDALEYAFIAEHLSAGHARLRVAGGSISSVMGMEVVGMPLAVLVCPSDRHVFTRHLKKAYETPSKLAMTLTAPSRYGQPELEAQMRLYPLRDAAGVTKLIGTFVTTGSIGRTPRRFSVASVEQSPVTHRSAKAVTPLVQRGHLSLVVSN